MQGISPEAWKGQALMPTAFGEAATPSASHPPAEFLSFMNGLPNAAAIIGWSEGAPFFQIWNSEFARKFPPMVDRAEANSEQWIAHIRAEIIAFVLSGAPQRRFEVERMSPLGIEAFDCTLALIDDPCVGGQRVLLNALDRTADRRVEESLRRELVSDSLTALPNRVGFGELMEETIARHAHDTSTQLGVLIVDLKIGRAHV